MNDSQTDMDRRQRRLVELLDELQTYFSDVVSARQHFVLAQKHGLHITPNHFYFPIPDTETLPPETWTTTSAMPGVDMNEAGQLHLMNRVFSRYTEIFASFPREKTGNDQEFTFDNDQISGPDPFVLYSLIRELKPRRVIEVGGGYSTLVIVRALRENGQGDLVCIEPYPRHFLPRAVEGIGELVRQRVQEVGLELFTSLQANDIVFIDSTHVVRIGGDVNFLFLETLPRLAPGVWVEVHDIFLPYDYPETWTKDFNFFWTEQYLLQAFLSGNQLYRTRFAVGYMGHRYPEIMRRVFPGWDLGMGGGSFWMSRENR